VHRVREKQHKKAPPTDCPFHMLLCNKKKNGAPDIQKEGFRV
jgi:hypothetical protein